MRKSKIFSHAVLTLGCALWLGSPCPVLAQSADSAGKVLQIGAGARWAALGEAAAASVDDVYALFWNPAGLARITDIELTYMHNLWVADIHQAFLGYAQPLGEGDVALSVNYVNFGVFDRFAADSNGLPVPLEGSVVPYAVAVSAGYGFEVAKRWRLGGALKVFSENVEDYSSMTLAVDAGVQVSGLLSGLDAGLVVENLGLPLDGYSLPMRLRTGVAYAVPVFSDTARDALVLAVDAALPFSAEQPQYIQAGLEYSFHDVLAGRVGYRMSTMGGLGPLTGLTAGLGLHVNVFRLDYAFMPLGELGNTHRVSLTASFAAPPARSAETDSRMAGRSGLPRPEGGLSGGPAQSLVPSLSGLSLRKPIRVSTQVTLDPAEGTRVAGVIFDFEVNLGVGVKRWGLKISDPDGRTVHGFSGEGKPGPVQWDGRTRDGRVVTESIFCTYSVEVLFDNGSVETVSGKLEDSVQSTGEEPEEAATASQRIFSPVLFEESSFDLTEAALQQLKKIAKVISQRPYITIEIEGYSDDKAEVGQAFLLSRRRADAVSRYLTSTYKIPLKSFAVFGRGNKNPIASNQTEDGRRKNRRVEIKVVYKR